MYLRFVRLLIRIFTLGSTILVPIVVPVNLSGRADQDGLEAMSLSNIVHGSPRIWAHLAAIYVFSGIVLYLVHGEFDSVCHAVVPSARCRS